MGTGDCGGGGAAMRADAPLQVGPEPGSGGCGCGGGDHSGEEGLGGFPVEIIGGEGVVVAGRPSPWRCRSAGICPKGLEVAGGGWGGEVSRGWLGDPPGLKILLAERFNAQRRRGDVGSPLALPRASPYGLLPSIFSHCLIVFGRFTLASFQLFVFALLLANLAKRYFYYFFFMCYIFP